MTLSFLFNSVLKTPTFIYNIISPTGEIYMQNISPKPYLNIIFMEMKLQ